MSAARRVAGAKPAPTAGRRPARSVGGPVSEFAAARRSSRQIRAFCRISRLTLTSMTPHDVGTPLLREFCGALGFSRAEIWLHGADQKRLWRYAAHGSEPLLADRPSGMPLQECRFTRMVLRRQQGIYHPDLSRVAAYADAPDVRGVSSIFAAPLLFRRKPIGLLYADRGGRRFELPALDLELGSALAMLCAEVIQRALSRQRETKRNRQIALLNDINQAITDQESLPKLLPRIARMLRTQTRSRGVVIGLLGPHGREFQVAAVAGSGGPRPIGRRIDVMSVQKARLCRRAAVSKHPAALSDFTPLPRAMVWWPGVRSALSVPMRSRGRVLGMVRLESERPFAFDQEDQEILGRVGEQIGHAVRRARFVEELHRRKREVQAVSENLERMLEEDRQRIARELHDELAQSMTAARINLGLLRKLTPNARPEARRAIRETEEIIKRTIAETRRISMDLRPAMLDDLGLTPALNWLADTFSKRTRIAVVTRTSGTLPSIDLEVKTLLYRFVQEALTNVARHARASAVEVDLCAEGEWIRAMVRDDGAGIVRKGRRARPGFGLLGMRERIERLGGRLTIDSKKGAGTVLSAEVPAEAGPRPTTGLTMFGVIDRPTGARRSSTRSARRQKRFGHARRTDA